MNLIQSNVSTMSSREIAELTGKQIGHIHRDFKKMMSDLGYDNKGLMPNPYLDQGFTYDMDDQNRISAINLNYELTLTIISGYNVKLRNAIIKRWQELESAAPKPAVTLPGNYIEALQALIESEKDKAAAQEQLQIAAPKVEYHDKVLSAANGLRTTEVAAEFGMSAMKLNLLLQDMKVQRKIGKRWVLTAAMLGQDLTVESTYIDDCDKARHSMLWTEKGRKLIHELIGSE